MCQSSSKYVHPSSSNHEEVSHSPESFKQHKHSRNIEYYPVAHFRRGGGHYPTPVPSEPYSVLLAGGTSTPSGQHSASGTMHRRIGYSIGPSSSVSVAAGGHASATIYSTSTSVPTPKSRCNSRISLPAVGKHGNSDLESGAPGAGRLQMTSEGKNTPSQHRTGTVSARVYNRYYNDCTMVSSNSNSALNVGSSVQLGGNSSGKGAVSSISGISNTHSNNRQPSSFYSVQQQFNNNSSQGGESKNHSSLSKGSSIIRLNGSRVLLNNCESTRQQYPSASDGHMNSNNLASQSNSCSDLVLREVSATNSSGNAGAGGGGGGGSGVHRVRSGSSMRSMGKLSQYSISLEDDMTNSVGALT